nr:MAG TPA: hypothetical protein [Caudoviricetes sp.]
MIFIPTIRQSIAANPIQLWAERILYGSKS